MIRTLFNSVTPISEIFTHPADLPVQALGENDPEAFLPGLIYFTGAGDGIQDRDSPRQASEDFFR